MPNNFQVRGTNESALFTMKLHRGDGMTLLAMNWRNGLPPVDFVGFGIEYKEPNGVKFFALKNRLGFEGSSSSTDPNRFSTLRSPIQKFRWVHFPRNAELPGNFTYRVTPVFMNSQAELSYGEPQQAAIELRRETYPGLLNVSFTRGFVSSQAFVDRYESFGAITTLLPSSANEGLVFEPTHPKAAEALAWMGFESRSIILEVLDQAIADTEAEVFVIAYDLNEPGIVSRLEQLGNRLKIIIDNNSNDHGKPDSGEQQAEDRLVLTAGRGNVKRQHMGSLQHNKTIVVKSPALKFAVCGSTNFSWRGFFIQANNALILQGDKPVSIFTRAFDNYWHNETVASFGHTDSTAWQDLELDGIDAKIAFSPHTAGNKLLQTIADDIEIGVTSSLFYSLAFLYQTPGVIQEAIKEVQKNNNIFVYGMSDRAVEGLELLIPNGNLAPVFPAALAGHSIPEPFKKESSGGRGIRLHHKFIVVDFDKPTARVYLGSYNFSIPADTKNGENLLLIKDRRVAVSFMIEALRIFDHYHFRIVIAQADASHKILQLAKPPKTGEVAWWEEDFIDAIKIKDRELFSLG